MAYLGVRVVDTQAPIIPAARAMSTITPAQIPDDEGRDEAAVSEIGLTTTG
jgi:hypothetical protein